MATEGQKEMNTFPENFVQLAAHHCDVLKVKEEPKGSNRGPWVDKYLAAAGLEPGYPWCAAFVTYLLKQVKAMPKVNGPAAVVNWKRWAEKNGKIVEVPKRGDLFFYVHPNGTGHIGIVLENKGATFRSIEGNTNDDGSREGYEVCRRVRSVASCRFIRL